MVFVVVVAVVIVVVVVVVKMYMVIEVVMVVVLWCPVVIVVVVTVSRLGLNSRKSGTLASVCLHYASLHLDVQCFRCVPYTLLEREPGLTDQNYCSALSAL